MSTACKQEHDCCSFLIATCNRLVKLQSGKLKYKSADNVAKLFALTIHTFLRDLFLFLWVVVNPVGSECVFKTLNGGGIYSGALIQL